MHSAWLKNGQVQRFENLYLEQVLYLVVYLPFCKFFKFCQFNDGGSMQIFTSKDVKVIFSFPLRIKSLQLTRQTLLFTFIMKHPHALLHMKRNCIYEIHHKFVLLFTVLQIFHFKEARIRIFAYKQIYFKINTL